MDSLVVRFVSLHNDSIEYDSHSLGSILKFSCPKSKWKTWGINRKSVLEFITMDILKWIQEHLNLKYESISDKNGPYSFFNPFPKEINHTNTNRFTINELIGTNIIDCSTLNNFNNFNTSIKKKSTNLDTFFKEYFIPKYGQILFNKHSPNIFLIRLNYHMLVDLIIFSLFHIKLQTSNKKSKDIEIFSENSKETKSQNKFNSCKYLEFSEDILRKLFYSVITFQEKMTLVILIAGASGSGKSTIASNICSRLSITRNISTDTIRAVSRTFLDIKSNSVIFHSTYSAGDFIEGKFFSNKERILEGYHQQCKFIESKIEELIETYIKKRRDPVVIEGVHLSPGYIHSLIKENDALFFFPCILVCDNSENHKNRFAKRISTITTIPEENKYIKYFENIQIIQDNIVQIAREFNLPLIYNTKGEIEKTVDEVHCLILERIISLMNK